MQIHNHCLFLENNPDTDIQDICFTAATGRSHFPYRFAAIAASTDDLHQQLSVAVQEETSLNLFQGHAGDGIAPEVGFDAQVQPFDHDWIASIVSDSHTLQPHYHLPTSWADKSECRLLLNALGKLYAHGAAIDWKGFFVDSNPSRISLPTYPFERKRHWQKNQHRLTDSMFYEEDHEETPMPFSGRQVVCAVPVFQFEVSLASYPFLKEHQIHGEIVIPVGAFWEMVLAAGKTHLGTGHLVLKNMTLHGAMVIPENQPALKLQVVLDPDGPDNTRFNIFCKEEPPDQPGRDWKKYVSGEIAVEGESRVANSFEGIKKICEHAYDVPRFTRDLYAMVNITGDAGENPWQFQEIRTSDSNALAKITFSDAFLSEAETCRYHPSIFEPCLQTMFAIPLSQAEDSIGDKVFLPIGFDVIHYSSDILKEIWCHVSIRSGKNWGDSDFTADFQLFDQQGNILAQMLGTHMRQASASAVLRDAEKSPCYRIQWQQFDIKNSQTDSKPFPAGCWLVLGDQEGVAEVLVQHIQADGGDWAMLHRNGNLRIHRNTTDSNENVFIDTPLQKTFEHVLSEKLPEYDLAVTGIIQCWGIDSLSPENLAAEEIGDKVFSAYSDTVELVRAIVSSGHKVDHFCFLTRGAQAVTENDLVHVTQAPLWAIQKCLEKEHPELNSRIFDLEGTGGSNQLKSFWETLRSGTIERETALRHDRLYVPKLLPLGPSHDGLQSTDENWGFDSHATYLITGGFGGVGMETAGWMVSLGVKHLVLLGRNDPGSLACKKIDELQKQGVQILGKKADVNNFEALSKALSDVRETMPTLKGVFHLAGIQGRGDILHQNIDQVKDIMAPKVEGAWNLHRATREESLDHFVLFSSISSLWGGRGLSAYAGANSFLDVLAHYRKAMGLPGSSINWGPFSQVGMLAEDQKGAEIRQKFGLISFPPLKVLNHFIRVREFTQACICEMDWKRFFVYADMKEDPFFSVLFNRHWGHSETQKKESG
ncbi:MAG: SDR family NAD(P)-dependent oxidoreductase, partial [Desulfobacterales bacterium]|nr:SDR family NAD(P)-dependent oxidoreductase [Desulfobacterales bacterium]